MMSNDSMTPLPIASTAGAQLRAARESLGLSQEAVAQQLKLAPRQVRAIEEDDYARLPGRTFVRGFVRNYARLVHLDPGAVIAGLPRVDGASPLDRASLTAVSRPMAELPVASVRRSSSARWLIPIVLLAIVAAAGVYEFTRSPAPSRRVSPENVAPSPNAPAPAGQTTTVLPNPLDSMKPEATAPAPEKTNAPAGATPAPSPPLADASSSGATSAPASAPATTAPPATGNAPLLLTFREKSWVEVKDGNGAPIFQQTGAAGTTQTVTGVPPFDVAIGNAAGVGVMFRGQPVDIAPFTHANIARFSLK
jgi:cytoskeleton protein RodZ